MATDPQFAVTPRIPACSVNTAEASLTAPTNFATAFTAPATGTRVPEIVVKCAAASAAALIRVFKFDGTNYWLFDELAVTAVASPSATVATFRLSTPYANLVLPSGWSLRFTTSVSQLTHITCPGAADL
jgi:hypothetical protein